MIIIGVFLINITLAIAFFKLLGWIRMTKGVSIKSSHRILYNKNDSNKNIDDKNNNNKDINNYKNNNNSNIDKKNKKIKIMTIMKQN